MRRRSAIAGIFGLLAMSTAAQADAPEKGSYDWTEMQPYIQFIQVMSHCCSIADGRIPYKQTIKSETVTTDPVTKADKVTRTYRVFMLERSFVTADPNDKDSNAYKNLFKEKGVYYQGKFGIWVDVESSNVISKEDALARCKPIIEQNIRARTIDPKVPEHTCNPPVLPILWLRKNGAPYCYWPEEQMGALEPDTQFAARARSFTGMQMAYRV